MNDTKNLAAKICIDGLKEIVLDALVEPKKNGDWLGPSPVRDKAGIHDYFQDQEAHRWTTPFTRAILCELRVERLVVSEERGPMKNGKRTLLWQLDKEEYHKRFSS